MVESTRETVARFHFWWCYLRRRAWLCKIMGKGYWARTIVAMTNEISIAMILYSFYYFLGASQIINPSIFNPLQESCLPNCCKPVLDYGWSWKKASIVELWQKHRDDLCQNPSSRLLPGPLWWWGRTGGLFYTNNPAKKHTKTERPNSERSP